MLHELIEEMLQPFVNIIDWKLTKSAPALFEDAYVRDLLIIPVILRADQLKKCLRITKADVRVGILQNRVKQNPP